MNYIEGRLLAKLKDGITIDDVRQIIPSASLKMVLCGVSVIEFEDSEVIDEVQRLIDSGIVEYAQPDHIYHGFLPVPVSPNDPYFVDGSQWALKNDGQNNGTIGEDIAATYAWGLLDYHSYSIGNAATKVGVIDSGVDYTHPDLSDNCKKADGFDFYNTDSDPMDDADHGTHVAGIIGAKGNNGSGIAGVAWNCRIYAVKALNSSMQGTDSSILYSIDYCSMNGVGIVNMSFGTNTYSTALYNAIKDLESSTLFICAAGNEGSNNDSTPVYPACYNCSNIISVCNTNNVGNLNNQSNYGATSVDIAAPGSNICSTLTGGIVYWLSGTSMAAPFVTGVAVLLKSAFPSLTVAQLKSQILDNVDVLPSLSGKCVTGGRLNAYKAFSGLLADPNVVLKTVMQSAIRDVPDDDKSYVRKNGTWDVIANAVAGGASGLMSGADKTKLDGIAEGAEVNVQSDWNQSNTEADDYIKNKPTIPTEYTLPTATDSVLGGVKVGSRLTITDGVLSADEQGGSYTLPTASADTLGGVKIGSGINITDGVISVTGGSGGGGGITWNEVTGTTQAAAADNGYIANNESLVTVTLPETCAVGKVVHVAGKGSGLWKIAQNESQIIYFGDQNTTSGTAGYLAAQNRRDCIELICITADTEFVVRSVVGNITVV